MDVIGGLDALRSLDLAGNGVGAAGASPPKDGAPSDPGTVWE